MSVACVCTRYFITVPINLTCPNCLQHFVFEHLFHLYSTELGHHFEMEFFSAGGGLDRG